MSIATTAPAAFQSFAEMAAEAEAQAETTTAALAIAKAHIAKVRSRITSLTAQRQGIISRRQRGESRPDDGATLELIAADTEGLAPILEKATTAEQAARARHQEATTVHTHALYMLARHEDEISEAALVQHAEHLGVLLFETMSKLEAIGRRLSRPRPAWGPSSELYGALRKLQSLRGAL